MALSAFDDPAQPPSLEELHHTLGPSAGHWRALLQHVHAAQAALTERWHHSGAKFGWSLRLLEKDRVVLYLTPQRDLFLAGLVLGERAARSAEATSLPPLARDALTAAPKYAEGRGIRLAVSTQAGLEAVLALLPFKMLPAAPRASRKSVRTPRGD
jgi:hypothetical protein